MYPNTEENMAEMIKPLRSIPLSERFAINELTTTPPKELTAINTPKAPALIPTISVQYKDK